MKKRGKQKIRCDYRSSDVFKAYCKETKNPYKLTSAQYNVIFKDFIYRIVDLMILKRFSWRIPYGLGYFELRKSKPKTQYKLDGKPAGKKLLVDYGATLKLWRNNPEAKKEKRLMYHFNEHTDGYVIKWKWDKSTCRFKGNSMYTIEVARHLTRYKAHKIKENPGLDFYNL